MITHSQIKIPSDASMNTQTAIRDIKDCLRGLENKMSEPKTGVSSEDLDQLRRELLRLTKKSTYQTWGDVFGAIKDFSFSSAPQSLDPRVSAAGFRYFTFEGGDLNYAHVSVGATAFSTSSVVGVYGFHNRGIAAANKRIALITGNTDGAQDSGSLQLWTMNAGTLAAQVYLDRDGNMGLGNDLVTTINGSANNAHRRFVLDGGTVTGQIHLGMTQAGTASVVAAISMFNRSITGSSEKRIAAIFGMTDGAINTGALDFYTWLAGVALQRIRIMGNGTIISNMQGPIATNATGGFFALPQCAGAPTGVPAGPGVNAAYAVFDTTNLKLWVYSTVASAWKGVVLA